ncbi:MAG: hypothetical protein GIX02_04935 [Candidatus Eremiobacteraeota bacterium]|nr:hypothetical protein [Candidatus Eremiobacteraeota bacterium]
MLEITPGDRGLAARRRLESSTLAVLFAAGGLVAGAPCARASTSDIPAVVEKAARTFSKETAGIVGFQRHFQTEIHGGPINHSEVSDSDFLMTDGAFTKIKYTRIVEDAKVYGSSQLAGRDADANGKWKQGRVFFKEPYDARYLADYSYAESGNCDGCPADAVSIRFTSRLNDDQHGDGTMMIDRSSGHVASLTYTPKVLPQHATSATITETGGQALPGMWYVTHIDQRFRGRAFLVSGRATFTANFDHFRRFDSSKAASAALSDGSI